MSTVYESSDVFALKAKFTPALRFALYRLLRTCLWRGMSYQRLVEHLRRDVDAAIPADLVPVIVFLDERFAVGCHLSEALAPLLPPDEALLFAADHGDRYPDVLDDAAVLARAAFPHEGASDPTPAIAAIAFALEADEGLAFLRCWNEGDFAAIRREWPEAPAEVFVGADPLHTGATDTAVMAAPIAAFAPSRSLLCKLGSILVHLDEHESAGGHAFDRVALDALRADPEVRSWMAEMDSLSLLPKKRA